ncbi:hypothetical protein HDE_09632 [Halotydeus destructor]|nr:hypothetical protein HDE_09632 [Halotydeus destructor]
MDSVMASLILILITFTVTESYPSPLELGEEPMYQWGQMQPGHTLSDRNQLVQPSWFSTYTDTNADAFRPNMGQQSYRQRSSRQLDLPNGTPSRDLRDTDSQRIRQPETPNRPKIESVLAAIQTLAAKPAAPAILGQTNGTLGKSRNEVTLSADGPGGRGATPQWARPACPLILQVSKRPKLRPKLQTQTCPTSPSKS